MSSLPAAGTAALYLQQALRLQRMYSCRTRLQSSSAVILWIRVLRVLALQLRSMQQLLWAHVAARCCADRWCGSCCGCRHPQPVRGGMLTNTNSSSGAPIIGGETMRGILFCIFMPLSIARESDCQRDRRAGSIPEPRPLTRRNSITQQRQHNQQPMSEALPDQLRCPCGRPRP